MNGRLRGPSVSGKVGEKIFPYPSEDYSYSFNTHKECLDLKISSSTRFWGEISVTCYMHSFALAPPE